MPSNFILNEILCDENYLRGADLPGVIYQGNLTGGFTGGEFSCYRCTVLCVWFSSLVSRREKIMKEEIYTLKEANVMTTICSENDHKNKRKQLL